MIELQTAGVVSTEWLSANLGNPRIAIVEANEDLLLYDIGHIPGAVKLDWQRELGAPGARDVLDGVAFAELMRTKGIGRADTVVLYGDQHNRWAAYTAWVFSLFGHADVRLLDGGRDAWHTEGRETTLAVPYPTAATPPYPPVERDDATARMFRDELTARLGQVQIVDARSAQEYTGDGVRRGGHVPTARNVGWQAAVGPDGRFRPVERIAESYRDLDPAAEVVVYCGTGEQACLSWFAMTRLLGFARVRVYDGSWAEWGNTTRSPIAKGSEPGLL